LESPEDEREEGEEKNRLERSEDEDEDFKEEPQTESLF